MIKLKELLDEDTNYPYINQHTKAISNADKRRIPSTVHANYNIVVDKNGIYYAYTKNGLITGGSINSDLELLIKNLLKKIQRNRSLKYY